MKYTLFCTALIGTALFAHSEMLAGDFSTVSESPRQDKMLLEDLSGLEVKSEDGRTIATISNIELDKDLEVSAIYLIVNGMDNADGAVTGHGQSGMSPNQSSQSDSERNPSERRYNQNSPNQRQHGQTGSSQSQSDIEDFDTSDREMQGVYPAPDSTDSDRSDWANTSDERNNGNAGISSTQRNQDRETTSNNRENSDWESRNSDREQRNWNNDANRQGSSAMAGQSSHARNTVSVSTDLISISENEQGEWVAEISDDNVEALKEFCREQGMNGFDSDQELSSGEEEEESSFAVYPRS